MTTWFHHVADRLVADPAGVVVANGLALVLIGLGGALDMAFLIAIGASCFLAVTELWAGAERGRVPAERVDAAAKRLVFHVACFALPAFVAWAIAAGFETPRSGALALLGLVYVGLAVALVIFDLMRLYRHGRIGGAQGSDADREMGWDQMARETGPCATITVGMTIAIGTGLI